MVFEAPAGATFREAQMCVLRDGLRKLDLEKSLPQPLLEALGQWIILVLVKGGRDNTTP